MAAGGAWLPVFLAIAVRVVFLATNWSSPFFRAPLIDARDFHDAALALVSGEGLPARPFDRPPLFIYFAAALYRVFGTDPRTVLVAHALLGVATVALTTFAGTRLLGRSVGIVAGCLLALSHLPLVTEGELLNETLQTFLLMSSLALFVARPRPSFGASALAVIAGALSILARPTSAFFVVPLFVLAAVRGRVFFGWAKIALLVALFGSVSSSALVRNRVVGKEWVPVSYNGGINFFVGNARLHDDLMNIRPGLRWERLVQSPRALEETGVFRRDPWAQGYKAWDDRYYRAAFEDIRRDLGGALSRLVRKALQFWSSHEIDRNVHPEAFIPKGSALSWTTIPFAVLGPLALTGLVLLASKRRERNARGLVSPAEGVWLGVGSVWLTCVIFFVTSRYRVPAYPMLALAAAVALVEGVRHRKVAIATLAAALVLGITDPGGARHVARARPSYLLGVSLERTGGDAPALRAFEAALREAPNDPDCLFSPTSILLRMGQPSRAAELAERAVSVLPDHPSAYFNLGLAYSFLGRHADAASAFARLIEVKPSETKAYYQLGRALIDAGRPGDALPPLDTAELMAPRMPLIFVEKARAFRLLGRETEARGMIERALRIDPGLRGLVVQSPELSGLLP